MLDTLRAIFGDASANELLLVALLFGFILMFSWAPKLGEVIGGLFEAPDE